jgi:hypothetical protein
MPVLCVEEQCFGVRGLREPEVKEVVFTDPVEGPVRFPQEFSRTMERARIRCSDLGNSEKVLGYVDSGRVYSALAEEFRGLPSWLFQEISRANAARSLRDASAA